MLQNTSPDIVEIPTLRDHVSAEEWMARVELAACYRLAHAAGWTDLVWTHISAAVDGPDHHFLLNPFGLSFDEVTASNLVKIGVDGAPVTKGPYDVNRAGFLIHGAIHEARTDVKCVIHVHTPAGMALSMLRCGLLPLSQHAARFVDRIAYHDYEGIVLDAEEKARLVANLGDRRVLILRNHGLLTVGRTVGEAFTLMYYLEKAAQAQMIAMATGSELSLPSREVAERTALQFGDDKRPAGEVEWPALLRDLQRRGVEFAV